VGPALAGFFSGNINFTLPVLIRHAKENHGVRRRSSAVTLAVFANFSRAGSAMVAAMALIVIIKSYSSLGVTTADLFFIFVQALGISFLLARHPGDGAYAAAQLAQSLGYGADDLASLPKGANMGLSCGNPVALASLREGEVVLDLGSGGGFDVFIAGRKVGKTGRTIGVDMTPEMMPRRGATRRCIESKPDWTTSSFDLERSSIFPWATRAWMSSSATASSTFRPISHRSGARLLAY